MTAAAVTRTPVASNSDAAARPLLRTTGNAVVPTVGRARRQMIGLAAVSNVV